MPQVITKTIKTTSASAKQDAIESSKPNFVFYFKGDEQFFAVERRGKIAHDLKCYRAHPDRYRVSKIGVHTYTVISRDNPYTVAVITADV